jgi:carbamoyl-phosphate synthase small subunit
MNAVLALEDGTWFQGTAAGCPGETSGEVVFNTSMTGYQEVLTDPSYAGQIVTMTAPQIGNYGVSREDAESREPQVAGFVMRESSPVASNWRADMTLREYLTRHGIVAIADIDTRALTRHAPVGGRHARRHRDRERRSPRARRTRAGHSADGGQRPRARGHLRRAVRLAGGTLEEAGEFGVPPERRAARTLRIAAYDFGIKHNILRRLTLHNCDVHVFPAGTPASDLLAIEPDGVFLSNGPGDPAALPYAIENVGTLVDHDIPMFGICLGHQVMGLALGGRTYKLKFGHRGANHPVKYLDRARRDHLAEPRLRRRPRLAAVTRAGDAPQSLRRHGRGAAPRGQAGVLGAVPPGGRAGSARRRLPVPAVHRGHREAVRASGFGLPAAGLIRHWVGDPRRRCSAVTPARHAEVQPVVRSPQRSSRPCPDAQT